MEINNSYLSIVQSRTMIVIFCHWVASLSESHLSWNFKITYYYICNSGRNSKTGMTESAYDFLDFIKSASEITEKWGAFAQMWVSCILKKSCDWKKRNPRERSLYLRFPNLFVFSFKQIHMIFNCYLNKCCYGTTDTLAVLYLHLYVSLPLYWPRPLPPLWGGDLIIRCVSSIVISLPI